MFTTSNKEITGMYLLHYQEGDQDEEQKEVDIYLLKKSKLTG